jgi:hypothetical protein
LVELYGGWANLPVLLSFLLAIFIFLTIIPARAMRYPSAWLRGDCRLGIPG